MTPTGSLTDEQLDALARDIMPAAREPSRVEQTRNLLLANAEAVVVFRPTRGRRVVAAAVCFATLAVAGWLVLSSAGGDREPEFAQAGPVVKATPALVSTPAPTPAVASPEPFVEITAKADTHFERAVTDGVHVVRFEDGTINVVVAGQRVLVAVVAATVESDDARFEVRAKDRALLAVVVFEGRVRVSPHGRRTEVISAGQTWTAPVEHAPSRRRVVRSEADVGRAFRAGWALLQTGKADDAAATFDGVCKSAGPAALGEDACFWAGAAYKRAKQPGRARRAFVRFLKKYPRSARSGEASALLGWLLFDANERVRAKRRFEAAAQDSVPNVRRSAESGLRALKNKREL